MRTLFTAIRFLFKLSWKMDRARLVKAFGLVLIGYLATPLIAICLRGVTDAALAGRTRSTLVYAVAIAVLLTFELMMGHFAHLTYFELGELEEQAIHLELLEICNGTTGIEHFDSAGFAEMLTLVREELGRLRLAIEAALQLAGLLVQLGISAVVLGLVNPWLALLPLAALPPVLISNRAQRMVDQAKQATAASTQLGRHLLRLSTTGTSVKEIRLFRGQQVLLERQQVEWRTATRRQAVAQIRAAGLRGAGQALFAVAYSAAIFLVIRQAVSGAVSIGEVVLVIALALQVSVQVAAALGLLSTLQGAGLTVQRIEDLRAQTGNRQGPGDGGLGVPERLASGIDLENVSFAYPGTDRLILDDISVHIPAGSSVALVGENGAGKSTLVKLLCGLYEPTAGRILIDGIDLRDLRLRGWQDRIAMLFQDFARLELKMRENVGIGLVEAIDSDDRLRSALSKAQARDIEKRVPGGLDGLLGRGYGDGAELSGGQWQKLGLARAVMRERPLLLALDEPAAALDATAENALFERLVESSEAASAAAGAVTLFVSHRFSTVRIADVILVLDGGVIVEAGSHDDLMHEAHLYAELFALQAGVYR